MYSRFQQSFVQEAQQAARPPSSAASSRPDSAAAAATAAAATGPSNNSSEGRRKVDWLAMLPSLEDLRKKADEMRASREQMKQAQHHPTKVNVFPTGLIIVS